MRRPDRRRALVLIASGLAAGVSGCAGWESGLPPVMRVGVSSDNAPLGFLASGIPVGIEVDLALELARRGGTRVTFEVMTGDLLLPALLDGRIDILMGGLLVTPQRVAQIAFTEPYMRVGQLVLVRERDLARLGQPASSIVSADVRVGVVRGTPGETFVLRRAPGKIVRFDAVPGAVAALERGDIDYFLSDAATIWRLGADESIRARRLYGLYEPLTEEYLAWAVRLRDTGLRERLSTLAVRMREDGTVGRIVSRWTRTRLGSGM